MERRQKRSGGDEGERGREDMKEEELSKIQGVCLSITSAFLFGAEVHCLLMFGKSRRRATSSLSHQGDRWGTWSLSPPVG